MSIAERKTENTKAEGYVANGLPVHYDGEYGSLIDLGLAANPLGPAIESEKLHVSIEKEHLAEYDRDVYHNDMKDLLIEGIGLTGIDHNSVIFNANGSYGAGDEVMWGLSYYLSKINERKPSVYVPTYSFPNVAQYAARHGVLYEPLPVGNTLFQESSLINVLQMGHAELNGNIVYIDYPNNPSGIADGKLLRTIVSHVNENKGIPFVDLAFGEVLGDEFQSAIQFTIDHGGVCVGSLTKTQGLPSLRAGYIIMNPELSNNIYNKDTRLVFGLPVEVKRAYQILFTKELESTLAQQYAIKAAQYNVETNTIFYEALHKLGLEVAPTNLETPIQIVLSYGDIYRRLASAGIKTESLADYADTLPRGVIGYGDSAVRILTPRSGTLKETLSRIELAMSLNL